MVNEYGFSPGALYKRQSEIHGKLGGQQQGGISTPADHPVIILFTGESGKGHGYDDFWDDDGIFHYVGEGQRGDMEFKAGNEKLARHREDGKDVLLFQALGKSKPCRYVGQFTLEDTYQKEGVRDTDANLRRIIVFKLRPLGEQDNGPGPTDTQTQVEQYPDPSSTTAKRNVEVRTKQQLFRNRLERVEKGCRITGIRDTRFLRAGHIKPWSKCDSHAERVDGNNGLLLAPHVDVLFNDGWISFTDDARLLIHRDLPAGIVEQLGLKIRQGKKCGESFNASQKSYMAFHRLEHEFPDA